MECCATRQSPAGNHKWYATHTVPCPSITCNRGKYPILASWVPQFWRVINPVLAQSCLSLGVPQFCPSWDSTPVLAREVSQSCRSLVQILGLGYPNWEWGTPIWEWGTLRKDIGPVKVLWDGDRVPLERTWNQWRYYGMVMGYPPGKDTGPVEVLWDGDGVPSQ